MHICIVVYVHVKDSCTLGEVRTRTVHAYLLANIVWSTPQMSKTKSVVQTDWVKY